MFALRHVSRVVQLKHFSRCVTAQAAAAAEPLTVPPPDGQPIALTPKVERLVADISQLTLVEVAELSSALKQRLNLPDAPMMAVGAATGSAAPAQEEEEAAPKVVKSNFTVKLMKFDDKQKVALIKEVKSLMEDMNLVQAKKFVESAPAVLKADISKDEAEKLKEALVKLGAEIVID